MTFLTSKPQQSISLWDRLCLAHPFETTLNALPENCLDRLENLSYHGREFGDPSIRDVVLRKISDDLYSFEIYQSPRGYNVSLPNAKISGKLFWDSESKRTVIQGKITTGMMIPFFALIDAVGMLCSIWLLAQDGTAAAFFLAALMLVGGMLFGLRVRMDYRTLQALIFKALE